MQPIVRKAEMPDRKSIHEAHMRSIREVCVKDHGAEEIRGWGFRDLGDRWIEGINSGLVWVAEYNGQIHGVASIEFSETSPSAHIQSLYLAPEVIGRGLGRTLIEILLAEAKRRGVEIVSLDSTITAHQFYKKFGFNDCGPVRKRAIDGIPVTSIPMHLKLGHT